MLSWICAPDTRQDDALRAEDDLVADRGALLDPHV